MMWLTPTIGQFNRKALYVENKIILILIGLTTKYVGQTSSAQYKYTLKFSDLHGYKVRVSKVLINLQIYNA